MFCNGFGGQDNCGSGFCGNNCCECLIWLLLILCCCGNGCGFGGFGGHGCNCLIWLILILCCCCGNKSDCRPCN
ncbi:MAG TPA: chorion class high-cysteine HCB protein 13 [Clostridiales bacterium]|nr:chorion class high-cysteine HCB protein 13 [Clostridiales bacterium]